MSRPGRPRKGLALPLALAAIVLVGILAASGLFLAGQERRAAERAALADRALASAEIGLGQTIADWDRTATSALGIGNGMVLGTAPSPHAGAVHLTRLADRVYWVVSEGRATRGKSWARRRVNLVLRLAVPEIGIEGAFTSGEAVALAPGAQVGGGVEAPCTEGGGLQPAKAGIVVRAPGNALGVLAGVSGEPPVATDPGAVASLAGVLATGSATHAELVERAAIVLPPGAIPLAARPSATADGCDVGAAVNWGEPREAGGVRECAYYRPVVHARGDLRLEGEHRGQGILVVDGSLTVTGALEYRGLVLVRGRLAAPGTLRLRGAALVLGSGADVNPSWLGPASVVEYERCEIHRALTSAGQPVMARDRGWADLY